jgi:hypothetical protein
MNWSQFIRDAATVATAYNTYQTSKKLDTLNESLDDFKNQTSGELSKLTATMQKGFSMLSMELAVQSQIFKNILNVLKEKRKTEAEELKNFGLKALRNGWIPDAIDDFNKSIELNRYDYQVYYLLSKCYFLQDDTEKQDHYLQMAFQYSSEDSMFRQYVGLDIVGQLVKEKKFDEAKDVVQYLEGLLDGDIELTPLLMCKLYIDIFSGIVNDRTLEIIDKAIDNYEGDEPSRIITVIKALSHFVNDQQKSLIENKLNLKKFAITKKYGSNVVTYLDNIEKILTFIYINAESSSILKIAPDAVIQRYFPLYKSAPKIIDRIREFKNRISNVTIDDYDKFNFVSPLLKQVEEGILSDVSKVYKKSEDGNFNSNPFQQSFQPELNFNVGQGDKILVQCKLSNNELITLTYFKLIIIDKNKNTFNYDLLDDFLNVDKDEIRIDEVKASDKQTDQITFYLRDKLSDKILLFSSSSYFTESYGSRDKYANILNLLWSRAINNILIYLNFRSFNSNLALLESCIDFIGVSSTSQNSNAKSGSSIDVEFLDSSSSDVEFIN